MFYKGRSSEKFDKIYRKTHVPGLRAFNDFIYIKKETSAKLFTCEFYVINTFFI